MEVLNEEEWNKYTKKIMPLFELQKELSEAMKQKIRAEYEAVSGSPDKPSKSNYFLNIMILIAVLALLTYLFGN